MSRNKIKLGFALSSGGSKGPTYLGILKRLEEEGIRPDVMSGTSAGAIMSAFYAVNRDIEDLIQKIDNTNFSDIFGDYTVISPHRGAFGFVRGEKFHDFLKEYTQNKNFEDVDIPLAFNAVDAQTSREVVLKSGSLACAVRASSSVPFLFKPHFMNGRYLIDGAVATSTPSKIARKLGADIVIAFNFKCGGYKEHIKKEHMHGNHAIRYLMKSALDKLDDNVFGTLKGIAKTSFFQKSLKFLRLDHSMIRHYLVLHNNSLINRGIKDADIAIQPDVTGAKTARDFYNIGYKYTDDNIEDIKDQIAKKKRELTPSLFKRLFPF